MIWSVLGPRDTFLIKVLKMTGETRFACCSRLELMLFYRVEITKKTLRSVDRFFWSYVLELNFRFQRETHGSNSGWKMVLRIRTCNKNNGVNLGWVKIIVARERAYEFRIYLWIIKMSFCKRYAFKTRYVEMIIKTNIILSSSFQKSYLAEQVYATSSKLVLL